MHSMLPIKPIPIPERRGNIRGWNEEISPKLPEQENKPLRFKWFKRIYWQGVWEKMVTIVTTTLRLYPKTAALGEMIAKLTKQPKSWIDKIIELIQELINYIKSWRKQ